MVPDADINTQMVLLEAARIFDERNRDSASPDETHPSFSRPSSPASSPVEMDVYGGEVERAAGVASVLTQADEGWMEPEEVLEEIGVHRLQIVTSDGELTGALDRSLPPGFAAVEPVGVRTAGHAVPGHEPPIVVLDLRERRRQRRGAGPPAAHPGRHAAGRPGGGGSADGQDLRGRRHRHGAAGGRRDRRLRREPGPQPPAQRPAAGERREAVPAGAPSAAGVERLRRVFGDLRSGLISATVALNLMHIISESVERAVLFLVKRDRLSALGAFGARADGRPLAELTRGMSLCRSTTTTPWPAATGTARW